ncbi:MAG TPA: hypothetical protein VJN67_19660, partial [Stellaceae bacterium]|nr:hypothetical protein [Stellaceae bacterium]
MSAPDPQPPAAPPPPPPPPPPVPYYAQPVYPPRPQVRSDNRALVALLAGIFGLLLFFLGLPAMILGPIAYFLGRSSLKRIDGSNGQLGGRSTAVA